MIKEIVLPEIPAHFVSILEQVPDPEVPVLNVLDLGVVRKVEELTHTIKVTITPTYTGCPAMDMIAVNIKSVLQEAGYPEVKIEYTLSPPWTTDWMTNSGKKKLKAYGIAPPKKISRGHDLFSEEEVECPLCDSLNTKMISEFGSTACKSLYKCQDCQEPFDYFKCH